MMAWGLVKPILIRWWRRFYIRFLLEGNAHFGRTRDTCQLWLLMQCTQ
jgi:hypothetical protein